MGRAAAVPMELAMQSGVVSTVDIEFELYAGFGLRNTLFTDGGVCGPKIIRSGDGEINTSAAERLMCPPFTA
jgi:hypothetical protein